MKKIFKKTLSCLLIAAMIITALPALAFAGGGGDDHSHDENKDWIDQSATSRDRKSASKDSYNGEAAKYYYVLAIHTGTVVSSELKNIILSYTDGGEDPITRYQVLRPYYNNFIYCTDDGYKNSFAWYDPLGRQGKLNTTGSYYSTFAYISGSTGASDYSQAAVPRAVGAYDSWRSAMGFSGTNKYSIKNKLTSNNVFCCDDTTYLAFETEYDFNVLKNIQFFFEGTGRDFSCQGWEIYRVPYSEKLNFENYAFFSDRVALSFNGTMIYRTTENTNKKIQADGLNKNQYAEINYIFYPISEINNVPKENASQKVVDGRNTAIPDYNFFESCNVEVSTAKNRKIMNFAIEISDTYEAGLESLFKSPSGVYGSAGSNYTSSERVLNDTLIATIEYTDLEGFTRLLEVPVLSNALFEYAVNNDEKGVGDSSRYTWITSGGWAAIAQQGDALCFSVEFPEIAELKSMTVSYADKAHDSDDFTIHAVSVYDNWGDNTKTNREAYSYFSANSIDIAPIGAKLLYESDNSGEIRMSASGTEHKFRFTYLKGEETCKTTETDYTNQNMYLVSLKTDSTTLSGTNDNVYVQFTYDTIDGKVAKSLEYNIREACQNYMGYNLMSLGETTNGAVVYSKNEDLTYTYGMSKGQEISFLMSIKNVKSFTGVTFRIDQTDDEWQLANLSITKLDTLGKRRLNNETEEVSVLINGKTCSLKKNGVYFRQITGDSLVSVSDAGVYLTNGETRSLDLTSAIVSGDRKTRDYSQYQNFMDYSTAMGDLKFDSAEKNYTVTVKVASNSTSATTSDDCGSSNLFYFQLVFKNGKRSAYVLANQQLSADGFRSGKEESFTIACNADMGDVVSINIIPDDTTQESQALDKLCIDWISVVKQNTGTVSKRYYAGNVGWIAPVYRDTSEETEAVGRSESELARNIVITSYGYMLDLEFSISYGDYPENTTTGEVYPQYAGNMTAEISYYTTNNEYKTITSQQIVQRMYEYAGKTPVIDSKTQDYVSDRSFMFRANTTDRFIINVDDIAQLVSIKLIGTPTSNTVLPIKEIAVNIVQGEGVLKMNTNDEYEMSYQAERILLAEVNDPVPTGKYSFTANASDYRTFMFSENSIPKFDDDTNLQSAMIGRTPDAANDTMNLYIYMNPTSPDPDAKGDDAYTLTTTVTYNSTTADKSYYVYTDEYKNLGKDNLGRTVLLAQNLSAENLSVITNVNLSCEYIRRNDIMVDHAVLQQVRNGVVINTYNVNFQSAIIGKQGGASTGPYTMTNLKSEATRQQLTLQLGEGTLEYKLSPEVIDIAVALTYTTKAKTANGGSAEYTSPFVFATDDPSVTSVNSGKILTFNFDEVGVDQITGIKVVAVGGVPATLEAATVICYEADSNNASVESGYFSFEPRPTVDAVSGIRESNAITLTRDTKTIKYSDDDIIYANTNESADFLRRFDITFKTMEVSDVVDSAGTVPIRMRISYKQHNGNKTTSFKTVADIRNYISKNEGFTSGSETKVSVYLPGLESVYSVDIEPYDSSELTLCSWNLESIEYQLSGTDDESIHKIPIQKTVYEDAPLTVNLSTIYVELAYKYDDVTGYVVNGDANISAEHGTTITFEPTIYQGTAGYKVVVYKIVEEGEMPVQTFGSDSASFNYKVENNGQSTAYYKLVVSSNDNAAAKSTINITIPPQSESTQGSK